MIAERDEEGIARVRELTGGDGTHTVLECVGTKPAIETAFGVVRDGGVVSRVGAPQYPDVPMDFGVFMRNITLTGGVAPARAYIEELLPDVLDGRIEPGSATIDSMHASPGEIAHDLRLLLLLYQGVGRAADEVVVAHSNLTGELYRHE